MGWVSNLRSILPVAVAVAVVGCALVYAQFAPHPELSGGGSAWRWSDRCSYGWPLRAAYQTDQHDYWGAGARPIASAQTPNVGWVTTTDVEFRIFGLFVNVAVELSMLTATALTAMYWMARPRRWYQMSLLEMLILFPMIGVLISVYVGEFNIYWRLCEPFRAPMNFALPLPVSCVLLFGVGCTVFLIGRVASTIVSRLVSVCRPDSVATCVDVTAGPTGPPSPAQGAALGRTRDKTISPNGA